MESDFDCYQAFRSRDARFDGLFFVGVKTTGIYCRPVCPARTPMARSCVFVATAAAAERAGFRPCLRCRPELAPAGHQAGSTATSLELALFASIRSRAPLGDNGRVTDLAMHTGFSARQLRRLTLRAFGVTPVEIVQTERLLFAKKLLQETDLPVTTVALSAGFGSLRRFNALVRARYGLPPSALRQRSKLRPARDTLRLRLAYRPPLAWREFLEYLAGRVVPGVEWVSPGMDRYARTVRSGDRTGWVSVRKSSREPFLTVELPTAFADALFTILGRLRALFDLDANPTVIDAHLAADPALAASVARIRGCACPARGTCLNWPCARCWASKSAWPVRPPSPGGWPRASANPSETPFAHLQRLAPTPAALAAAEVGDLAALGMFGAKAQTIRDLAAAAVRGELQFGPTATDRDVIARLCRYSRHRRMDRAIRGDARPAFSRRVPRR